jgi:hypothetical protein
VIREVSVSQLCISAKQKQKHLRQLKKNEDLFWLMFSGISVQSQPTPFLWACGEAVSWWLEGM